MCSRLLLLIPLLYGAAPLAAQADSLVTPPTPAAGASERLRYAIQLPIRTTQLRRAGVNDTTIHRLLEVFRQRGIPPAEVDAILLVERDAARDNGPTDNFGAFVQQQLDAGICGQALADSIRAEHLARGRGNGVRRS